jgi:hypothetical protein
VKLLRWHWLSDEHRALAEPDIVRAQNDIAGAIHAIVWPSGSDKFTIYAESGKKRGEGNGVRPIRDAFVVALQRYPDWQTEFKVPMNPGERRPGPIDGVLPTGKGLIAVEWETGNISSSHRSLNKLVYGLQIGVIYAGFLIAPSRAMYHYLTDRVGNVQELESYFAFWRKSMPPESHCAVIEVEHDDTSLHVPRISKGTDGRALV